MATRIDTVDARDKLKPRDEPYWTRIAAGCQLGFRKMTAASTGTWIAQYRDPDDNRREKRSLGEFEELPPSQRYDAAKRAAEAKFAHFGKGGTASSVTVRMACERYATHLRDAGRTAAGRDAEQRFARWVNDAKIGAIELQKLKPGDVTSWRAELARTPARPQDRTKDAIRPRAASSLNRDMSSLRAALNLAVENGDTTSDIAWKVKLRPVKDADRRRDVYLDLKQRRALIAKAPPDLAALLSALSLVPLRPGAMAALIAGNFDQRLATLTIGKDKHGQDRKITLPPATAAFFAGHCRDKLPTAPLFARADGSLNRPGFCGGSNS